MIETIGHIVDGQYPSKFCITLVFNFSLVLYSSQEKSKTVAMKKKKKLGRGGGGLNKVHFGLGENGECLLVEMLLL